LEPAHIVIRARDIKGLKKPPLRLFKDLLEASRALRRRRRERVKRIRRLPKSDLAGADAVDARVIRALIGLSQKPCAELAGIEVATLRNWEQGRRTPTGPARALLRAINNNPIEVVKALNPEKDDE
jgi:putative transcriptional regulator